MEADTTRSDVAPDLAILPGRLTSLPSISQLPTELLIRILQRSISKVDLMSQLAALGSHRNVKIVYTMRAVTKRWQDVIDGTPSFWTTLISTLPPHVNETSIIRSSNLPLVVIAHHATLSTGIYGRESDTEFLNRIQRTRSRWCALILGLYHRSSMSEYLKAPLPLLQKIIARSEEPLLLKGEDRTQLRSVFLSNVSILWPDEHYSQLKSLILNNVSANAPIGLELLPTLHASPGLKVLKLEGIKTRIPPPSPTITLHHLKCIKLRYCAIDLVEYVLRHIRAPSCTRLWVRIGDRQEFDVPHFLKETLESFHGALRTIHQRFGESEVLLDSDRLDWHTFKYSEMEGFSIFIGRRPLDPFCISWIDGILQNQPGLQITFGDDSTSREDVLRSVAPMRSVTKLFVRDSAFGVNVRAALQFIGQSLPTSTSLPSLPCLQELLLPPQGWDTSDLLEVVQSRFCALSWEDMERTFLTIKINHGVFSWRHIPGAMLDINKICKINGVQSVKLVGRKDLDGMPAAVWDEEGSEPV